MYYEIFLFKVISFVSSWIISPVDVLAEEDMFNVYTAWLCFHSCNKYSRVMFLLLI